MIAGYCSAIPYPIIKDRGGTYAHYWFPTGLRNIVQYGKVLETAYKNWHIGTKGCRKYDLGRSTLSQNT